MKTTNKKALAYFKRVGISGEVLPVQPQPDKAAAVLFHCCSCGLDSVNPMNCSHCGTVIAEPKRDKTARPT
jgi:hypothetical protein